MPIVSIIEQPGANALMPAYRPIVLKVRATRTDNTARPPVVYCDVYINSIFYKTIAKTQFLTLNASDSDWYFDIQDAAQEVLKKQIGANGGSAIILTSSLVATVFCRFRSSGYDMNNFILAEGTAPVQGTGLTQPVSGTGTQSNIIFAINSALQHEDNQNLSLHLNAYKRNFWAASTYPLTHRTDNYTVCLDSSDYFPIISSNTIPNCLRLHYRLKGSGTYSIANVCGDNEICTGVAISGSPVLPDGNVGTPYNFTITLTGTAPFRIIDKVKPSWMVIPDVVNGNSFSITGTPNAAGTGITVSFTLLNCNSQNDFDFSDTININSSCVNVGIVGSIDFPDGVVGQLYTYDIQLSGTPPFVTHVTTKPTWMNIPATVTGNVLSITGTPDTPSNGEGVVFSITNCTSGTVAVSDSLDVIAGRVQWDFSNTVSNGLPTFRIVVNNNTLIARHVTDSGTLDVNIGDIIEAIVSVPQGPPGATAVVSFTGAIIDDDISSTVASVGPYAVPAGQLHISGVAEPGSN